MLESITNPFNFFYEDYSWTDYRKYTTLFNDGYSRVYNQLPELPEFPKLPKLPEFPELPELPSLFSSPEETYQDILWNHKEWIIGTLALSVSLIAIKYFWSQEVAKKPLIKAKKPLIKAKKPLIKWETTLNFGRLTLEVPRQELTPPNVTLTFCIDTSGSMDGERETSVKRGMNNILNSAQKVVDTCKGAKIQLAVIGFSDQVHTISKATLLTPQSDQNNSMQTLRKKVNGYKSRGATNIIAGLTEATTQLEKMAKNNPEGKHVLILLSDGNNSVNRKSVTLIQNRLIAAKAHLFAIGIGKNHNKKTLKNIAPNKEDYIDTSNGVETIESAIERIYDQSIATFSDLKLSSPQLGPGTWSIGLTFSDKNSEMRLGSLEKDYDQAGEMLRVLTIHPKKLKSSLDLHDVSFDLTYRDPKGIKGRISLPWNPNTRIDLEIVKMTQ